MYNQPSISTPNFIYDAEIIYLKVHEVENVRSFLLHKNKKAYSKTNDIKRIFEKK